MKLLIIAALVTAVVANDIIDGEWIIKIQKDVNENDLSSLLKSTFSVDIEEFYHFSTFTLAHVKAKNADINRASQLSEILHFEPNQWFYTTQTCSSTSHPGVWGLDRIDQAAALPYTDPADASAVYNWGVNTGAGTSAYVVDTGIRTTHVEFGTRARWGFSASILPDEDNNGHGTHCAGTIGSSAYGVAKDVELVACKCLNQNGSGTTNAIVSCIEWSTTDAGNTGLPSTINLSLGGGISDALDLAVSDAVGQGVTVVCAAGNSDADACGGSPGREPTCITVGATDVDDQSATYTNWGTCVDVFAPGTDILSCWHTGDTDTNRISGTSMATPHVVGACNRYMSQGGNPTPAQVADYITSTATPNAITFRPGHETSPNLLLFSECV